MAVVGLASPSSWLKVETFFSKGLLFFVFFDVVVVFSGFVQRFWKLTNPREEEESILGQGREGEKIKLPSCSSNHENKCRKQKTRKGMKALFLCECVLV